MTGMRSSIWPTSSFESVVMIAKVRTHSPAALFQFSHSAATPKGEPSFIAMAYGCFALSLIAFHSKKPSIGTMQRLR
jgi:hypothetical protein